MSASIEKESLSDLTLNELIFCYQYCTFVKSQTDSSSHPESLETFLEHHPLPRDVDYPVEWLKDETTRKEAGDRFLKLSSHLPTTTTSEATTATQRHLIDSGTAPPSVAMVLTRTKCYAYSAADRS